MKNLVLFGDLKNGDAFVPDGEEYVFVKDTSYEIREIRYTAWIRATARKRVQCLVIALLGIEP